MNRIVRILLFSAMVFGINNSLFAQLNNVEDLLRGGVEDANVLLKEYISPLGKGFGADLNNGWFTTARPHKFLGFDITITANFAIAPEIDETFDISKLTLNSVRLTNPTGDPNSPTIIGSDSPGPEITIFAKDPSSGNEIIIGDFFMPEGIDFQYVPSPMIQAGLGIGFNTDVMARYLPQIEFDEDVGSLQMIGFGLKHSFTRANEFGDPPPIDISIFAGYTTFQAQSKDINLPPDPSAIPTGAAYDDQEIELEANSFTANLIISKSFPLLTLFGSVGYETSSMDLKLKGTYPITAIEDNIASPNFGQKAIRDLVDPINISIDGANALRGSAGLRLKLLFLAIHGSYTFADYPVATAGLSFDLR
ncbi:MAG: DUF6588 family protein [bacterium]